MSTAVTSQSNQLRTVPLRVAVINDFDLIVRGVSAMLSRQSDRLVVVDVAVGEPADEPVDVALVDTFGDLDEATDNGMATLERGYAKHLIVYTWDVASSLQELADRGHEASVVSKAAGGDVLTDAIERTAAGEIVVAHPRRSQRNPSRAGIVAPLSDRELEALAYMADGLTNPQIAQRMSVSLETVKTFARRAFPKIGAKNRAQAAAWATKAGLERSTPAPGPRSPVSVNGL